MRKVRKVSSVQTKRKGQITVPETVLIILGIVMLVVAIIIVIRIWNEVKHSQCWTESLDSIDRLCLDGGITCDEPSDEELKTIELGICVDKVMFFNKGQVSEELMKEEISGEQISCPVGKPSYIVIIPDNPDFYTGEYAEYESVVDAWKQSISTVECNWYKSQFFPGSTPMVLEGPSAAREIVSTVGLAEDKVSYCIRIHKYPGTDGNPMYQLELAATKSCSAYAKEGSGSGTSVLPAGA